MIVYRKTDDGKWLRVEFAKQCTADTILTNGCVGAEGHSGEHWSYSAWGAYEWEENKSELTEEELLNKGRSAGGWIPPANDAWVNPEKKINDLYIKHQTIEEVMDPKVLDMLENEETPEEDASIDQPVEWDEENISIDE